MFEIPADLPPEAVPLAWLLGVWEGQGVVSYSQPAGDRVTEFEFGQRVAFTNDGLPALNYNAFFWRLDEALTPLTSAMGYWRLAQPAGADIPGPGLLDGTAPEEGDRGLDAEGVAALRTEDGLPLEVSVVHPDGVDELYVGALQGARITLATDAVLRSRHARPYESASRMYGLVERQLLWSWDLGAFGNPLTSHASATLRKVSGPGTTVR